MGRTRNAQACACMKPYGTGTPGQRTSWLLTPHYSWTVLLQSPIRCCDKPSAGGLAPRTLTVLYEYAAGSHGYAHRSRVPSLTLPH